MDLLESKVVAGAFHTADENYDAPKCHPNTRVAILDEIMAWLDDTNDSRRAMWMRGAAGAGKSAIARTIAQMCEKQGRLSASFFFSRTANDTRRSDVKYLVATLVHQMVENIPEIRQHITTTMLNNQFIFDLALETQINKLLVDPLSHLSDISAHPILPKVIIIDGLDECRNKDAQNTIVKGFVEALAQMQHNFPHRLLIASRPEQNIQSSFGLQELAPFLRHLPLDNSWKPDDDIRTFLVDSFADIRQTHPLRRYIPVNWPAPHDIEKLVEKSSGQFIYAATVSKYIKSNEHHPVECLQIVINLVKDPENRPYAELDALYAHIFAQAKKPELALCILRIHLMESVEPNVDLPFEEIRFIERFLGLGEGKLELTLTDLLSIVEVERQGEALKIKFLHASLPDFLLDETRAGRFYANSDKICVHLFRRCLNHVSELTGDVFDDYDRQLILTCFKGPEHFAESVREAHLEFADAFASVDLKAALKLASKMDDDEHRGPLLCPLVAKFLRLILREHTKLSSSQSPDVLLKVVNQLPEWISNQLQKLPLDGPISSSLENNDIEKLVDDPEDPELYFCWSLMSNPKLTAIFCGVEQLGAFAINGNTYAYAAQNCCRFIFSALSCEQVSLISFKLKRRLNLSAIHARFLLGHAAPRVDVYLSLQNLVMIRHDSMQEDLCQASSSDEYRTCLVSHLEHHFRQQFLETLRFSSSIPEREREKWETLMVSLVDYLVKTREEFPSLEEQGSPHVQDERQTVQRRAEHPRHPMSTRPSSSVLQAQPRNEPTSKKRLRTNSNVPKTKKPRKP
ncbi:hypothetical protein BDZ97DRAFT_1922701 [Flammula alnicola]|nr:hypothetical protein BDZ97DRAFT_1922701 [Flammula alnicola]